jgi:hypothetical protein
VYEFTVRQCKVEGGVTAEVDGKIPLRAPSQWKPLLLLIPLRLGLSEINPVYINGLKVKIIGYKNIKYKYYINIKLNLIYETYIFLF